MNKLEKVLAAKAAADKALADMVGELEAELEEATEAYREERTLKARMRFGDAAQNLAEARRCLRLAEGRGENEHGIGVDMIRSGE